MKEAVQEQKVPKAIAEAVETLRIMEKRITEANAALVPLDKAIEKARKLIAEKADTIKRIADLRAQRRTLLADELLGKPDKAKIETLDREMKILDTQFKEIAPLADDAESAVLELERRRARAAEPAITIAGNLPGLRANLLSEAARVLLAEYGEAICTAYDRYLEVVCLVPQINQHARAAGLAPVMPEVPDGFEFPGVNLGDWKRHNGPLGVDARQVNAARERLAKKLIDLGVSV